MEINLGDEVQSKITGAVGKVIEISENRDIKVLEKNGFISIFSSENALIKKEGLSMSIVEQVEKLVEDMKQLLEDINTSDVDVIDLDQLKDLSKFCEGYACDIREIILGFKEIYGE